MVHPSLNWEGKSEFLKNDLLLLPILCGLFNCKLDDGDNDDDDHVGGDGDDDQH